MLVSRKKNSFHNSAKCIGSVFGNNNTNNFSCLRTVVKFLYDAIKSRYKFLEEIRDNFLESAQIYDNLEIKR